MPTKSPEASRPIPTRNHVFFSLRQDPEFACLAFKSDQKQLITLIQAESDSAINAATPSGHGAQARGLRALQLRGMLELLALLMALEVQVPSMLDGIIRAEIGRVSQ